MIDRQAYRSFAIVIVVAILAAIVLGVVLLVGSVYLYVRLAVFLFGDSTASRDPGR